MIKNAEIARRISLEFLDITRRIDDSVRLVAETCPETELQIYRRAAGEILGAVLTEILNPLYAAHPYIKPKELK